MSVDPVTFWWRDMTSEVILNNTIHRFHNLCGFCCCCCRCCFSFPLSTSLPSLSFRLDGSSSWGYIEHPPTLALSLSLTHSYTRAESHNTYAPTYTRGRAHTYTRECAWGLPQTLYASPYFTNGSYPAEPIVFRHKTPVFHLHSSCGWIFRVIHQV